MLTGLFKSQAGSSTAEMALVTPLLITLMFGAFELGNYFLSEHVVVKAVRDGARYAGRLSFSHYNCTAPSSDNTPTGAVVTDTQNLVRTGQLSGGTARLRGWTDANSVKVTYDCISLASVTPAYSGIYDSMNYVPVVKVEIATDTTHRLQYKSLFNQLGFTSNSLYLNAKSQSPVMGL